MNIAIDIRSLLSPHRSGVGEYSYQLLNSLFRVDDSNEYFLFYNSWRNLDHLLPNWTGENIHYIGLRWPNKILNLSAALGSAPFFDRLIEMKIKRRYSMAIKKFRLDTFFLPNWNFINLSNDLRKVITIHDVSCLRTPDYFSAKSRLWHRLFANGKYLNQFQELIAVSENTKNDLIKLFNLSPDKIKVVPSGIDERFQIIPRGHPRVQALKKTHQLTDKTILYLGNIDPRKNIQGTIDAFQIIKTNPRLNDYQLVIAGGPGFYKKYSPRIKPELKSAIKFIGYINDADKPCLYALADLLLWPSFYEGFGFPPLEAMASGTPVITSFCSSLPEVVGKGALLVDPHNTREISEGIKILLTDKNFRQKQINHGLDIAARYRWDAVAAKMKNLF